MKHLRPRTFVIFALAALSGALLLHISQDVRHAEERLKALEVSVSREEEKIRMLKAEWAALNRPERLESLAEKFLDLVPPPPERMVDEKSQAPQAISGQGGMPENREVYEPALQPVTYQSAPEKADSPPVPASKPGTVSAGSKKEKAFGELLNELGGAP